MNDNENGYTYQIGSGSKNYYNATDAEKLKGTESVIISVTCHDGFSLMKGNTQYKCHQCGKELSAHTKECAMATTVSEDAINLDELDRLEQEYRTRLSEAQAEIRQLELDKRRLEEMKNGTMIVSAVIREQYNTTMRQLSALQGELNDLNKKLSELAAARAEAQDAEDVQTDDYYRIPAIMQDCRTTFNLSWTDAGSWSGYTFTRHAKASNMDADITFRATISMARKPSYFLGIKIHRAIIQIEWELTADMSDTQVVEVLELDPDASDRENATLVNQKISEIAQDYPDCTISTEYLKTEAPDEDNTADTYHLLWSSDRLEIARKVEARLSHIYADLISLEKMMNYKLSIIDVLKAAAPHINDTQGKRLTILEEAHQRWMQNARGVMGGGESGGFDLGWRFDYELRHTDEWEKQIQDGNLDKIQDERPTNPISP